MQHEYVMIEMTMDSFKHTQKNNCLITVASCANTNSSEKQGSIDITFWMSGQKIIFNAMLIFIINHFLKTLNDQNKW